MSDGLFDGTYDGPLNIGSGPAIDIVESDRIVTCPHGIGDDDRPVVKLWVGSDGVGVVEIYACVTCKDHMVVRDWHLDGRLPYGQRVIHIGRVDYTLEEPAVA